MKYKDPVTGEMKTLSVKAADTLPIGTIVDYDGDEVPDGWEEVDETDDYSTEETLTGKHWIDGKPIYRKVITTNGYIERISTGISNLENMIKMNMLIRQTSYNDWRNVPWCFYSNNETTRSKWLGGFFFDSSTKEIVSQFGSELQKFDKMILILEYTKSTD